MNGSRRKIIKAQKELVEILREYVYDIDTLPKKYREEVKKESLKYKLSNMDELITSMLSSEVVFVGDDHSNRQSQKTLIELMEKTQDDKKTILAIEYVNAKDQDTLDKYMQGEVDEETLLKVWDQAAYRWAQYKPILKFARDNNIQVVALDKEHQGGYKSLESRDRFMAKRLNKLLSQGARIFVSVGDLHVSPQHMPNHVKTKKTIVIPNIDKIYWRLVRRKLEKDVDVVKMTKDRFCLFNTTPVAKYLARLNGYRQADLEINGEEYDLDFDEYNPEHIFGESVRKISNILGLGFDSRSSNSPLPSCILSTLDDLDVDETLPNYVKGDEKRKIMQRADKQHSLFVPLNGGLVFISNPTINHFAEMASRYLKFAMSGEQDKEEEYNFISTFYDEVMNQAVAYFGSKLINDKRKAKTEEWFREQLEKDLPEDKRKSYSFIIAHKQYERTGQINGHIYRAPEKIFFRTTMHLGRMLGEKMYKDFEDDKLTKEEIHELFKTELNSKQKYQELVRK